MLSGGNRFGSNTDVSPQKSFPAVKVTGSTLFSIRTKAIAIGDLCSSAQTQLHGLFAPQPGSMADSPPRQIMPAICT